MSIADRLKTARAVFGLTQDEIASRSGVPKSTYQKYEMGLRAPGAEAVAGFVKLGINANWLLTGEGEMLTRPGIPAAAAQSRYARRWEKIVTLINEIEDDAEREEALDELYAIAKKEAEFAKMRRTLAELKKAG